MSYLPPPTGVPVTSLTAKTDSLGPDLITFNRGGVDYSMTVAAFLAANQTSVSALPAGPGVAAADILAAFSAAAANDVRYTMAQIAAFALQNIPSWTTSTRPALANGQVALGYNTTVPQLELGVGTTGAANWKAGSFS